MAVYRVSIGIAYDVAGGPATNVYSVRTSGVFGQDDLELQDAVNALHTFYGALAVTGTTPTSLFPQNTTITLEDVIERDESAEATADWTDISASGLGTNAPSLLALCISWRTSLRARRGMGRTFIGPLSTTCVDSDGTPTAGTMTVLNGAAQALVEASDSATGWALGVWGQQDKLPDATPDDRRLAPHVHRDITTFVARDRFAVMRSRRD